MTCSVLQLHPAQLAPRGDAELPEYVRKVEANCARAQKELGPDLTVAQSLRAKPGDLQLLRSQTVCCRPLTARDRYPRRAQLCLSPLHPGLGVQLRENVLGSAQLASRLGLEP